MKNPFLKCFVLTLLFVWGLSTNERALAAEAQENECIQALRDYFSSSDSREVRAKVLKIQGQITLNRLAWAYLKKSEDLKSVHTIQDTIRILLEEKANNSDPEFKAALENFEKAPLSRKSLADVAPYLGDILREDASSDASEFLLNSSDAKLLSILAQNENNKFTMSSNKKNTSSILNFASIINSSYRDHTKTTKFYSSNYSSLEAEMDKLTLSLNKEIASIVRPSACSDENLKNAGSCSTQKNLWEDFIAQNALSLILDTQAKLTSHGLSEYRGLQYGDLWLKVASVKPVPVPAPVSISSSKTSPTQQVSLPPSYFKDPVHIIVQDRKGRTSESFKGFDDSFLQTWARAIYDNKKTFVIKDQIYDRTTGKSLNSNSLYQEYLKANSFSEQTEKFQTSRKLDSEEFALRVNALKNKEGAYVYKGKLYNVVLGPQDPIAVIVDYKKKNGVKASYSQYKSMDQSYLSARALAILNKKNTFLVGDKEYATDTGFGLNSQNRDIASAGYEEDYKIESTDRKNESKLSDLDLIVKYHKEHSQKMTCPYYAVVDKKNSKMDIFSNSGSLQRSFEVLLGKSISDKKTTWIDKERKITNPQTGAGIFEIRDLTQEHAKVSNGYYQNVYNNKLLNLYDPKGVDQVMAVHQVPNDHPERLKLFNDGSISDNRISNGCINVNPKEFDDFYKYMTAGSSCKFYVLPEEPGNRFVEKNDELNFTSDNDLSSGEIENYNFNSSKKYFPTRFKIVNDEGSTPMSRKFVQALQNEKAAMMKAFNLDNDDYNDLAMIAYGIMGQESKFGKLTSKIWLKELPQVQDAIWLKKCASRLFDLKNCSDIKNSRGFTQIKSIPEGVKKYDPTIDSDNLIDGRNAAVATMGFLAETLTQIKAVQEANQKSGQGAQITRETRMDYMIYLYMGSAGKLKKEGEQGATPETNIYIQNVKKYIDYLDVKQKMNP